MRHISTSHSLVSSRCLLIARPWPFTERAGTLQNLCARAHASLGQLVPARRVQRTKQHRRVEPRQVRVQPVDLPRHPEGFEELVRRRARLVRRCCQLGVSQPAHQYSCPARPRRCGTSRPARAARGSPPPARPRCAAAPPRQCPTASARRWRRGRRRARRCTRARRPCARARGGGGGWRRSRCGATSLCQRRERGRLTGHPEHGTVGLVEGQHEGREALARGQGVGAREDDVDACGREGLNDRAVRDNV